MENMNVTITIIMLIIIIIIKNNSEVRPLNVEGNIVIFYLRFLYIS